MTLQDSIAKEMNVPVKLVTDIETIGQDVYFRINKTDYNAKIYRSGVKLRKNSLRLQTI